MVDYFLIVVCIVFTLLSMFVGFYTVTHFQHPEDRHTSWFPKIIVTLALGTSAMNVLLLPLDSLNRSSGSTIRVDYLCWLFTIISAALAFFIIPFTMNLYENYEDDDCESPVKSALCSLIPFILFVGVFGALLWTFVGVCEIPIDYHLGEVVDSVGDLDNGSNCSMYFSRGIEIFF